jgi:hypothetical protein
VVVERRPRILDSRGDDAEQFELALDEHDANDLHVDDQPGHLLRSCAVEERVDDERFFERSELHRHSVAPTVS